MPERMSQLFNIYTSNNGLNFRTVIIIAEPSKRWGVFLLKDCSWLVCFRLVSLHCREVFIVRSSVTSPIVMPLDTLVNTVGSFAHGSSTLEGHKDSGMTISTLKSHLPC